MLWQLCLSVRLYVTLVTCIKTLNISCRLFFTAWAWCGPTEALLAVPNVTAQINRDIARKSRFFRTPLHSTPPLGGFQSEYHHTVWYRKTSSVLARWWKNFDDMFSRFDRIRACDRQADRRMDRQPCLHFSTWKLQVRIQYRRVHCYDVDVTIFPAFSLTPFSASFGT